MCACHINNKKEFEFNKHGHNIRINIKQGIPNK